MPAVVLLAACGGGPRPVDQERLAAEEARLVAPFEVARTLVADEVELTMTANFYDRLTLPSLLPGVQEEERLPRDDGGTEFVLRTNSVANPLRIEVERTRFFVLRTARVTVLGGRQDLTLRAEATGSVSVVENDQRKDFGSVRIENGAFRVSEVSVR